MREECVWLVVDAALNGRFGARMPFARQNTDVSTPEGGVAEGVADGIYCAVDVTQIVGKVPQFGRETIVVFAASERFDQS